MTTLIFMVAVYPACYAFGYYGMKAWYRFEQTSRWFRWSTRIIQRPMFNRTLRAHMQYAVDCVEDAARGEGQ